jgi:hypothetical protein
MAHRDKRWKRKSNDGRWHYETAFSDMETAFSDMDPIEH